MTTVITSRRRSGLSAGAALVALAVAAAGAVIAPSEVAHAAPYQPQTVVFSSTSGTNYTVPAGVTSVLVALRGGDGGAGRGPAGTGAGGEQGDSFSLTIPVQGGDVLTVFAARSASGSKDEREGGAGYIRGGTGGKGSGSGGHAGGGGGAAAVKLNNSLVAVASGGGGGGGGTMMRETITYGNAGTVTREIPVRGGGGGGFVGGGKTPGLPGVNAEDVTNAPGRGKPGGAGGGAGFFTDGGGGGGGGAGWPVSGTGGGGGRKFMGVSGGSGGGSGMSWISASIPGLEVVKSNIHPVGTVSITVVPVISATLTGPAVVHSNQPVSLNLRTIDGQHGIPISGTYSLTVAGGSGATYETSTTNGSVERYVGALPVGTHVFTAIFRPTNLPLSYSSTFTVRVEPEIALAEDPADISTSTVMDAFAEPVACGNSVTVSALVTPAGAANLADGDVVFTVDGISLDARTLTDQGDGTFRATAVVDDLDAGLHNVSAYFSATEDATASYSGAVEFTITPAATATQIIAAPPTTDAFAPIDVTATVSSDVVDLSGTVALLADGVPVEFAQLDDSRDAFFEGVVIPWGTTQLTASYWGGTTGNFATSLSGIHPITVNALETETELTISSAETRADEPVQFVARVVARDPAATEDPRGDIEILFDGELALVIPVGLDADEEIGDAEARFELDATGLELGGHEVTARFVPAPGFEESQSDAVELLVVGLATQITLTTSKITLPAGESGSLDVGTTLFGSDTAVSGSVQAFRGGVPLGDPVAAWEGSATVLLPGLAEGIHEIELRFTPEDVGQLPRSATLTVTAVAAAVQPSALAPTGAADGSPLLAGALVLLMLGGVITAARARLIRRA